MFKFLKKGAFMLLVASLVMGVTSCKDDDPDFENVTPPEVEVAPAQISGVVTSMDGTAVSGATVKAAISGKEVSATTASDGTYVLEDVAVGTYAMEVSADGKLTDAGEVKVSKDGEHVVYNAMLASDVKVEITVSATEEVSDQIKTEVPEENKDAEVTTTATIPAAAIEDAEAKIILSPVYTEKAVAKSKAVTRAAQATMLMGTQVSCSKEGVVLKKPISLSFDMGADVAEVITVRKNVNGQWSDASFTVDGDNVIVEADGFGTYSVFADVDVTESSSSEAISFSQMSSITCMAARTCRQTT